MLKFLLIVFFVCLNSYSTQYTCHTPSRANFDSCYTLATYGDTINLPACDSGTVEWTSGYAITKNISIFGAGTSSTFLNLNFTDNSVEEAFFQFTPDATARANIDSLTDASSFTVSGIYFVGNNRMTNKFGTMIINYNTPPIRKVMIHDCKYYYIHRAVQVGGYVHGVFYDCYCHNSNASYPQGSGSSSFANDTMKLGSGKGWYIEDNTFVRTSDVGGIICGAGNEGGGFVVRYNDITGTMTGSDTYFETHGNQLSGIIGPQITEIYGNNASASSVGVVSNARGGKNIYMFNLVNDQDLEIWEEYNDSASSLTQPTGRCYDSKADVQECTDECICQKVHDSYFFQNRYSTTTGTMVDAVATMDYWHRDSSIVNDPAEEVEDREYFNYDASFDGTSGVGCGTLASRPATCTVGVGYWATDQSCSDIADMIGKDPTTPIDGVLYKCTATDTWTEWYTPYTYPHPLRTDAGGGGSELGDTIHIPSDYPSLKMAIDSSVNDSDLVTADRNIYIIIDSAFQDGDTTITIDFTGDETHRLYIEVNDSVRHYGVYDTTKYRIVLSDLTTLFIRSPFVTISGIQFYMPANGASYAQMYFYNINTSGSPIIYNCIFRGPGDGGGYYYTEAIQIYSGIGHVNPLVKNCLAYDWMNLGDAGAFVNYQQNCTLSVYNCTFNNCIHALHFGDGAASGGSIRSINNIFYGCTKDFGSTEDIYPDRIFDSTNSTTNDSVSSGLIGKGNRYVQQFSFFDSSNKDFHLDTLYDTAAFEKGVSLDSYFTDDVDGNNRPIKDYWDIGFDEGDSTPTEESESTVDSIRPNPWYKNRIVSFYGTFPETQGSYHLTIGAVSLGTAGYWSTTIINDTIPNLSPGNYHAYLFTGSDSTSIGYFRVVIPRYINRVRR